MNEVPRGCDGTSLGQSAQFHTMVPGKPYLPVPSSWSLWVPDLTLCLSVTQSGKDFLSEWENQGPGRGREGPHLPSGWEQTRPLPSPLTLCSSLFRNMRFAPMWMVAVGCWDGALPSVESLGAQQTFGVESRQKVAGI